MINFVFEYPVLDVGGLSYFSCSSSNFDDALTEFACHLIGLDDFPENCSVVEKLIF